MTQKTKNSLVFLACALAAAGVYAWSFPFNRGTLELKMGGAGYRALVDGEEVPCPEDPCLARLKTGSYTLLVQKEKHITLSQPITIKRGKVTRVETELKRQYVLEETSVIPKPIKPKRALPAALENRAIGWEWNGDESRLVYLDSADERVKIRDLAGVEQPVTVLKNIEPPLNLYWSDDETLLLGNQGKDLYFIDVKTGARQKKTIAFEPRNLHWSPNTPSLFFNAEADELYRMDFKDKTPRAIGIALNLKNAAWMEDGALIYFVSEAGKNATDLKTYDPETGLQSDLTTKFDFLATRLVFDASGKTAYVQKEDGKWFALELE